MKISNNQLYKMLKTESADSLIWKHIQGKLTFNGSQLKKVIDERKKKRNEDN